MPRFYMVRHGRPAGAYSEDPDPGLDDIGREQAEAVAKELAGRLPKMGVVTSPKKRALETAAPLARMWSVQAMVEPGVSEIPSPIKDVKERGAWLRGIWNEQWVGLDPELHAWRANVIRTLTALPGDAVIFTHFVPINVAVGVATGDDRLISFSPDHCSITIIDLVVEELRLIEKGREAQTTVR